jgi:uncharacterized membrane protein
VNGDPALRRTGGALLAWRLCWLAWTVLFLQQFADAAVHGLPWIAWLFKLLPLLVFLPGMRADRLRSFIWLCFLSLLYFVALVERLFARPDLSSVTGLCAVITLFVASMLYVRLRARQWRAAAGPDEGVPVHD